jgi:2-polyprenyl-3-methyl-5-hydroxy-6-metoxy-1,4-benzoquinol methylase
LTPLSGTVYNVGDPETGPMTVRDLPFDCTAPATDPPIQWDDAPCPLCGATGAEIRMEGRDHAAPRGPGLIFPVVECRVCQLSYTNPRPDQESIVGFYPDDYRPHRRPRKLREARSSRWKSWFTGRAAPERRGDLEWVGRGRLLDFGCGGGGFLRRMADRGWSVTGLDASVGAAASVREELGLNVLVGSLPHPELLPGSFDVITMWHSLEHVHEPLTILRDAYELLVPGGQLIVACPNRDSWPAAWFGANWFGLDLPRHVTHFTPRTLHSMLATAGFVVETQRLIRHSDWLRSSAKLAARDVEAPFWSAPLQWKPVAKLTAWLTYLAGKSDCMMAIARRPLT